MAKDLKRICGDFYNPRKHDIEFHRPNEPSERYMNKNYQNQATNYKPLAELQTVPPYGSFYNTTGHRPQNQNPHNESLIKHKQMLT